MPNVKRRSDILKEPLHHAYIIEGVVDHIKDVLEGLEGIGVRSQGNPDIIVREYNDGSGIEDTREIRRLHFSKPINGERKFFILWIPSITVEAQNAFLKILEEPSGSSHFFIISPDSRRFLPTILSRVEVIRNDYSTNKSEEEDSAKEFLNMDYADRLELSAQLGEEKDVLKARILLSGFEVVLHKKMLENYEDLQYKKALEEVIKCEEYIRGRSPSIKMIFEHLSLVLPLSVSKH